MISGQGVENIITDTKQDAAKSAKAKRTADKATLKMHDDVTTSLEQLEHPGVTAKKVPEEPKTGAHKHMTGEEKIATFNQHKHAGGENHKGSPATSAHKDVPGHSKTEIQKLMYSHISKALAKAKFPISTRAEFISAFPHGAETTCHVGNCTMTAGDAEKLIRPTDFPFRNVKSVADVIIARTES
ncbi:MAG: MTH865 family protein [Methanoregula sp.]|uniref:MTH865 family protein n=1 Tax=Methanoregula sp. TaxID=2052170 RepID=UPI003BB1E9AD